MNSLLTFCPPDSAFRGVSLAILPCNPNDPKHALASLSSTLVPCSPIFHIKYDRAVVATGTPDKGDIEDGGALVSSSTECWEK